MKENFDASIAGAAGVFNAATGMGNPEDSAALKRKIVKGVIEDALS